MFDKIKWMKVTDRMPEKAGGYWVYTSENHLEEWFFAHESIMMENIPPEYLDWESPFINANKDITVTHWTEWKPNFPDD